MSRDHFEDALPSKMCYWPIISTIATSWKTTPSHVQQEEIVYDLLQIAQSQSTTVNWGAPRDAEIMLDKNDQITPQYILLMKHQREVSRLRYLCRHSNIAWSKCTYRGDTFCEHIPPPTLTNTHLNDRICYKLQDLWHQLTPPKLIPVKRKLFRPDSIQSQIPTMQWTLMVAPKALTMLSSMTVESTAEAAHDTEPRFRTTISCKQLSRDKETTEFPINPAVLHWRPAVLCIEMAIGFYNDEHLGPTNTKTSSSQGYLYHQFWGVAMV